MCSGCDGETVNRKNCREWKPYVLHADSLSLLFSH
jgi:hypothetical protein